MEHVDHSNRHQHLRRPHRLTLLKKVRKLLLAKICFGRSDTRINSAILHRTRHTVPQVSLDGKERRRSLKNAFTVTPGFDLAGTTICLVDDVYTTGTTVSECSKRLLSSGAASVIVLTFARVDVPHRGRSLR